MAQTNVKYSYGRGLKSEFDAMCSEMGLTMTTAFTVFAKAVTRKRAIPFEISAENIVERKAMTNDTVENLAGILQIYANPALIPCESEDK